MSERPSDPPAWAEVLVTLLTPARAGDTIAGDLLEEHAELAAARGARAAYWWYGRQALGFARQAAVFPGVALALSLGIRTLIDIYSPREDLASRAAMTTYVGILIFTLAGFRISYRTHRVVSAVLVTVLMTAIATALQLAVASLAVLAIGSRLSPDSATARALREGFDVPVVALLFIGLLAASLGGAAARVFVTRAPGSRWSMRT